jgi:hypothetical protein
VVLPPLLRQRSLAAQLVLAVVAPVAFGALCGYVLGSSEPAFNLLMLLAGVGGVLAGFEHLDARQGAIRGIVGGVLFTGALVVCFTVRGAPMVAHLPLALPGMAVLYAVMGVPLGALGGRLRRRAEARRAGATAG